MIYTVGICDSDICSCKNLESYISKFFKERMIDVDLHVYKDAKSMLSDIEDNLNLNILFVSMDLEKIDGMDLGRYIRKNIKNVCLHIIYLASDAKSVLEVFDVHPYDFILKPIKRERVLTDLQDILELEGRDKSFFQYSYHKKIYRIPLAEIDFFMSDRHHIKLFLENDVRRYVGKLKEELEKLPDNFVLINQSYIINVLQIKECRRSEVVMNNGSVLTVSRRYKEEFNEKLKYIFKKEV